MCGPMPVRYRRDTPRHCGPGPRQAFLTHGPLNGRVVPVHGLYTVFTHGLYTAFTHGPLHGIYTVFTRPLYALYTAFTRPVA